ncbi:hypothetical protein P8452_35857 [Trifolium repens]|nr:hypothetical protein QL285_067186 [Trifolium repens]WJX49422.1 hypothetical protein P8452_35857 [Trifolium repens]
MAYAKLAPLAIFFLATFLLMFPVKKVEAACPISCLLYKPKSCGDGCKCVPASLTYGVCVKASFEHVANMVKEQPNLCQSHADCTKNGSGSFCARFPNPDIEYGWCFDSSSDAQASFKNALNSESSNFFLKMPSTVST